MKKCAIFFLVFAFVSIPICSQGDEGGPFKEIVIKRLQPYQLSPMAAEDGVYVKALVVGATAIEPSFADWAILDFASEYYAGDVWNMIIVIANYSPNDVKINIEFELRWNDGAKKIYRRWGGRTIQGATVMMYMTTITDQIRQLGLFTLYGRASGLGVGSQNEVVSQLYIY